MKNVTITLDEETARWARIQAAMQRYLARTPTALKDTGRYPAREELHDRAGLR